MLRAIGPPSTVVECGTTMRVDAGSNPAHDRSGVGRREENQELLDVEITTQTLNP